MSTSTNCLRSSRWSRAVAPLVLASALLGGCNKSAAGGGEDAGPDEVPAPDLATPPQAPKAELVLSSTQLGLDAPVAGSASFDLTKIVDLWVRVKVPESQLPAETILKLEFISPKGSKFYEDNSAFSKDMLRPVMNTPDVDVPLNTIPATRIANGMYALDRPIPVAGSAFDRYPQYGTWILQASFDRGQPLLTTMFEIVVPKR